MVTCSICVGYMVNQEHCVNHFGATIFLHLKTSKSCKVFSIIITTSPILLLIHSLVFVTFTAQSPHYEQPTQEYKKRHLDAIVFQSTLIKYNVHCWWCGREVTVSEQRIGVFPYGLHVHLPVNCSHSSSLLCSSSLTLPAFQILSVCASVRNGIHQLELLRFP